MSEKTPERLQAFRDANAPASSSWKAVVGAIAVGVLLGTGGTIAALYVQQGSVGEAGRSSAVRARELALLYERKDMPAAAIAAYSEYLDRAALSDKERADVAYSAAKLAVGTKDYERALEFLYRAEFWDPDSNVRDERSAQILRCLEQLGRDSSLRRELQQQTRADATPEPGAVVLAEFGDEFVTDRDLERRLDEMPEAMRGAYSSVEQKTELLKSLVAERLLLDRAYRMKLDEDDELQARMKAMHDSLLVQKLMENEVSKNMAITPEDVERYYKAEPEQFTQRASAKVLIAHAASETEAAAITEFNGQAITVREGEPMRGMPNSQEVVDAIFAAEVDAVTNPIAINDRYFVFKIVSKSPERIAPFEEVHDRAEQMLRAEKEQELVAHLIEETLRARDVKLYPERFEGSPPP